MPKGVAKKKPASRFLILDADKYLHTPQLVSNPEETQLEKLKAKRMKRRLDKIAEMEADMYLSEVETELKKKKVQTKTVEAGSAQSDQLVKGLIENPQVQQQWINMDPQQRNLILASIQAVKSKGGETAGSLGGMMPLLFMQMQRKPDTSIAEMVNLIKTVSPPQQPQVTIKDIIELQKSQQGQQSQTGMMKEILDTVRPLYQTMSSKDQQIWNERLQRMEQDRINPLEYLKEIKTGAETLGISSQNNPTLALEIEKIRGDREMKLEELRQARITQERQFAMEQQNRQWDREDNKERWSMVQGVLEGPVGQTIQNLGSGVQQRISGKPSPPVAPRIPNPVSIACPKCSKSFIGSSDAATVVCPHCGTQLNAVPSSENVANSQKQNQSTPSQKSIGGMDGSKVS